jgi:hypothetical protein
MFWQRTAELSYLVGVDWNDIIASNARIIETIAPLNPCLAPFSIQTFRNFSWTRYNKGLTGPRSS